MVVHKSSAIYEGMSEVLAKHSFEVVVFDVARLEKEGGLKEAAASLPAADLLILGRRVQEKPAVGRLFASREWRAALKGFLESGGVMFSLVAWVYSDAWTKFFSPADIWYPEHARIKPYQRYREAFPGGPFRPNGKLTHPLLSRPHKLSGIFGYQNFGYLLPERKEAHGLIVREGNSRCVGVSLQESVLGKGTVIFSNLFLFMSDGGKMAKHPGEPLAHHSVLFLENLATYVGDMKSRASTE